MLGPGFEFVTVVDDLVGMFSVCRAAALAPQVGERAFGNTQVDARFFRREVGRSSIFLGFFHVRPPPSRALREICARLGGEFSAAISMALESKTSFEKTSRTRFEIGEGSKGADEALASDGVREAPRISEALPEWRQSPFRRRFGRDQMRSNSPFSISQRLARIGAGSEGSSSLTER